MLEYQNNINLLDSIDEFKEAKEFWMNILSNQVNILQLPTDYLRVGQYTKQQMKFNLPEEVNARILEITKANSLSIYTFMLSIMNILLMKYTGHEELIVGIPPYGTSNHEVCPNKSLAIKSEIHADRTFKESLLGVKQNLTEVMKNQFYPLPEILKMLGLNEDISSQTPINIVMTNIHDHTHIDYLTRTVHNEITMCLVVEAGCLSFNLVYNSQIFKEVTIKRLGSRYINILKQVLNNTNIKISEIEMLSAEEKQTLLSEFNQTSADYPKHQTLHELFQEQADKTPDNIALVFGENHLTYRELNERANQLAWTLREKGVGAESIVWLLLERSLEMVIAIIAILKAGGGYLPIDPDYPTDRIKYTLEDSGTTILLTQKKILHTIDFPGEKLDVTDVSIYAQERSNLPNVNIPTNLAYIIYTSGTTGQPKGAIIEHKNVVRLLINDKMHFDFNMNDVWTMFHSYCFDVSVWEMYGALLYGGKLIIVAKATARDPKEYLQLLKIERVTILNQIPTPFYSLMKEELEDSHKELHLRYVIFAGEALKPLMLKEWVKKYPETKLVNMYGITETTVHVTYKLVTEEDINAGISNIGKPLPTLTTYIMDKNLQLQPIGIPGELCVGGDGVGRGYLKKEQLTSEKFILNPYKEGDRLYRSGDLARMLENGEMEYLGRMDHQVKIRGFRVEIGEIENKLLVHEVIKEVAVVAKVDKDGSKYLCAYFVGDRKLSVPELRQYLSRELPDYMVPAYFVQLEKIPQTPNGKIDHKALPSPIGVRNIATTYVPPVNQIQRELIDIWKKVLFIDEEIGIKDNFFELGGHSLKATEVANKIYKTMNVNVPLHEFFKRNTVEELANLIENLDKQGYNLIEKATEQEHYPLSAAQRRMYIANQKQPDNVNYNMPFVVKVDGDLDVDRLKRAFALLLNRHESLRTYFTVVDGNLVQRVDNAASGSIEYIETVNDLQGCLKGFIRPFDLEQSPLIRLALIKMQDCNLFFAIDMHHIISDGVSMEILLKELIKLYKGEELPPLSIQYKDFAVWQKQFQHSEQYLKEKAYWLDRFANLNPIADLPTDYLRGSNRGVTGERINFAIDEHQTLSLKRMALNRNVSLFMILLSAYKISLCHFTENNELIVGTPIAGRTYEELENIIGVFINTLALKSNLDKTMTFEEVLEHVSTNVLMAYSNQSYEFDDLIHDLNLRIERNRNPLFDTLFAFQNVSEEELYQELNQGVDNVKFSPVKLEQGQLKFDIKLVAYEANGKIEFCLEYASDLFKPETMHNLYINYVTILQKMIENPTLSLVDIAGELAITQVSDLGNFNDDLELDY